MIIDNYSLYRKKPGKKYVYLLEGASGDYEALHRPGKRNSSEVPLYVTPVPDSVQTHSERKPALSISGAGGTYLSGLFIPNVEKPHLAYGDLREDALLLIIGNEEIELFVCKGKKAIQFQLFCMLQDDDSDIMVEIADYRVKLEKALSNKGVFRDSFCPPLAA